MSTHRGAIPGLIVLGWLVTCASTLGAQPAASGGQGPTVVTIPDLRLYVPAGEWSVERDVANAHITLIQHVVSRLGPRADVRIDVRVVRADPSRALAPVTAARRALDAETASLRAREKGGWTYKGVARDTTIGCRALVGERYRLEPGPARPTVADEEGTVFAWTPPDYRTTGRVVLFRLTMVTQGAQGVRVRGEEPFLKVIETLELQATPEAVIC